MGLVTVKGMDRKRFDALAGYSRDPLLAVIGIELAWFSNIDETILGVLVQDRFDRDFNAVLLCRDEARRFRAFDTAVSLKDKESAMVWLCDSIQKHTSGGLTTYPQGDDRKPIDLFTPVVPEERQHPYFTALAGQAGFASARGIINSMMPYFTDVDGNFVEQFQSTGFDARVWELCLYAYLVEEQFVVSREHNAPDFLVTKGSESVAIEAVTVGRADDDPPRCTAELAGDETAREVADELTDAMPIRWGSPLYSKLKMKYWELPHVAGNPLVFAVADFHDDQSMLWSSSALIRYLYGVAHDHRFDGDGNLIILPRPIGTHKVGDKEIPSGFFFQPDAEYISAVLSSASGTVSKFNRMGRQAGFKAPNTRLIRTGKCYDHDPNAALPKDFEYEVNEESEETWAEGFSMLHNPEAKQPVPEELFPSIAHHHFRDGQIYSSMPEFHPYASITIRFENDPT